MYVERKSLLFFCLFNFSLKCFGVLLLLRFVLFCEYDVVVFLVALFRLISLVPHPLVLNQRNFK